MSKTYRFEANLTLKEALAFQFIANFRPVSSYVYSHLCELLDGSEFEEALIMDKAKKFGVDMDNNRFTDFIDSIIKENSPRKTVTIGEKTYYEDELAEALKNIKEVK